MKITNLIGGGLVYYLIDDEDKIIDWCYSDDAPGRARLRDKLHACKIAELNRLWAYRLRLADLLAATNCKMSDILDDIDELGSADFCQECQVYYLLGTDHVCQVDKE